MTKELDGETTEEGQVIVDCSTRINDTAYNFDFGNFTISIPYYNFIIEAGDNVCLFGALPSTEGISLLGDSFLRSAYVVFDQTNMEISMAKYQNCGVTEQAIADGGVSGIKGSCNTTEEKVGDNGDNGDNSDNGDNVDNGGNSGNSGNGGNNSTGSNGDGSDDGNGGDDGNTGLRLSANLLGLLAASMSIPLFLDLL